jgi:hypothetical protein
MEFLRSERFFDHFVEGDTNFALKNKSSPEVCVSPNPSALRFHHLKQPQPRRGATARPSESNSARGRPIHETKAGAFDQVTETKSARKISA